MSWRNQNNGGGGGPWGRKPPPPPPNHDEVLRRLQERLRRFGSGKSAPAAVTLVIAVAVGLWALSGFYRVLPDEQGVELRFGKYTQTTAPGLHYRFPRPIEDSLTPRVTIVNREDVGLRGPQPSQSSFLSSKNFNATRDVPEESLMLTGDENIVNIDFSVFWVIKDAGAFLFNVENPTRAVKAVAESAMREVVGKSQIQPILTQDRQKTENDAQIIMQTALDSYGAGVEITQVKLQQADPPDAVIDSFRDVQAARADQERARNEAAAYANKVVPEARGEAQKIRRQAEAYREQTIADAEGQASRFLAIYNEYRSAARVTRERMFLETMEKIMGSSSKIILDSGNDASNIVPYLPLDQLRKNSNETSGRE